MNMIFIGTLAHVAQAIALSFVFSPGAIMLMFWFKEIGEAKHKVRGSIKTLKKNIGMVKYTFRPEVIVQWAAPGVAAYLVQWLLT